MVKRSPKVRVCVCVCVSFHFRNSHAKVGKYILQVNKILMKQYPHILMYRWSLSKESEIRYLCPLHSE